MNELSIFGATGFIGSRYCELYPDNMYRIPRSQIASRTNNILYFISTVDNYNIFTCPLIDVETNIVHLIKVLETCKKKSLTFNFISSWFVYGDHDEFVKEDAVCNPKGFYSITKRTAEQILINYCETFDIAYRIIRSEEHTSELQSH